MRLTVGRVSLSCDTTENLKVDNPIGEVKEYFQRQTVLSKQLAWDQLALAYIL